jgi:hypothetical protein
VEDRKQTRDKLRSLLADPSSTPEQVLRAKLVTIRRIANASNDVIEVCHRYGLTQEQTQIIVSEHRTRTAGLMAEAEKATQEFERLLRQLAASSEADTPAV